MAIALWLALLPQDRIDDLIRQLGADDPETRERATKELSEMGDEAYERASAALKTATDPEVRARLELVLHSSWRTLAGELGPANTAFSRDGWRVAVRLAVGHQWRLVVAVKGRKQEEPLYADVGLPVFAPAGGSMAYRAQMNGRWTVVVDGKAGETFDWVDEPVFSPDGKRAAYRARSGKDTFMIVDGKKGGPFGLMTVPVWSPDGTAVAFGAGGGDEFFIVKGDKKSEAYDGVSLPAFSPDGKTLAFGRKKGKEFRVVAGEKESDAFDSIGEIAFSGDGKTMAFVAREGRRRFVVVNGKKGEAFAWVRDLQVSADGGVVAYRAATAEDTPWVIVTNDRRSEPADRVMGPVLSPSGVVAYASCGEGERDRWSVFVGERAIDALDVVSFLSVSPDGKTLHYGGFKDGLIVSRDADLK